MNNRGRYLQLFMPLFASFSLLMSGSGCAPTHAGRTLGRGVLQIEGALGGPFVSNLGFPIPIPNVPVGLRYGVTDRVDVQSHTNLLTLFAGGFLVLDGGATMAIIRHEGDRGPNLAVSSSLVLLTDFQEGARVSPVVDFAGGYTIRWFTIFAGFELLADFWRGSVHADPYIGFEFDIRNWSIDLLARWFHPAGDAFAASFEYTALGNNGAIGIMLGLKWRRDLHRRRGDDS